VENNHRDIGQWFKSANLGEAPANVNAFGIIAAKLQRPLSDRGGNRWPHSTLAIFMRRVDQNETRH
jgi:hypothetical protein